MVFFGFSTIFILPNRISPTCFGDAMLNSSPAIWYISLSMSAMREVSIADVSPSEPVSMRTPLISMSASTCTNGISTSLNSAQAPASLSRGSRRFFRRRVTSASSAAYSYTSSGRRSLIDRCPLPFGPISSSMCMVL